MLPGLRPVGRRHVSLLLVFLAILREVVGRPSTAETEYLTSFPLHSPALLPGEFAARFKRHGAVLLRMSPSWTLPKQAMPLVDKLLKDTQNVTRIPMQNTVDNVRNNQKNETWGGSPTRILFRTHHMLGEADDTVQGPHQEGVAYHRGNRRILAFACETPAVEGGATAFFDMQRAWELLPADLQRLLANASFGFRQYDGKLLVVPAVVRHDVTDAPCLQFYCFGRLRHACVDTYREQTGHYDVRPDAYMYKMHDEEDTLLIHANGTKEPFVGLDLYRFLASIYATMISHSWSTGHTLLVDNIRWAHARLEGKPGSERRVHFWFYGDKDRALDLFKFARPVV